MAGNNSTKDHIIKSAIKILKEFGTEGLTMRKVATNASMSLGNLQYHFKNKEALFSGLAEHYFSECAGMLDDYKHTPENGSNEEKLYQFILFTLDHFDEISDMCRIFAKCGLCLQEIQKSIIS